MAAISESSSTESLISSVQDSVDRIKSLYPAVNEEETPLPKCWSQKDKFTCIGLSQNNLRVHYKGIDFLLTLRNQRKQTKENAIYESVKSQLSEKRTETYSKYIFCTIEEVISYVLIL